MNLGHISSTSAPFVKVDSSICFFTCLSVLIWMPCTAFWRAFLCTTLAINLFSLSLSLSSMGLSLKSVVLIAYLPWNRGAGAPSYRAAPGLSYRQLPAASAVTGLVVRCLAVFNVVSNFCNWCYCHFAIVQNVLCYLAHVDFLMMPDKTVKSNQSITSYHKHINFLCYIQQNWMKWYISFHVQRGLHSYVY